MADVVVGTLSFASTFCCCVDDAADGGSKLAKAMKIAFLLVDIADFVLDGIFVANLAKSGEGGWAALMACAMVLALGAVCSKGSEGSEEESEAESETMDAMVTAGKVLVPELMVFMIEDATTILIFIRVDGAFDPSNLADVLNVFTTTASAVMIGSFVLVFTAYASFLMCRFAGEEEFSETGIYVPRNLSEDERKARQEVSLWQLIRRTTHEQECVGAIVSAICFYSMFSCAIAVYFVFNSYLLIEKLLGQKEVGSGVTIAATVMYVVFFTLCTCLISCAKIITVMECLFPKTGAERGMNSEDDGSGDGDEDGEIGSEEGVSIPSSSADGTQNDEDALEVTEPMEPRNELEHGEEDLVVVENVHAL